MDEGFGVEVAARLERFKIRTAADILPVVHGQPDERPDAPPRPLADTRPGDRPDDRRDDDEVDRILAGVPKMGVEITEGVIPAELGQAVIDASVSRTRAATPARSWWPGSTREAGTSRIICGGWWWMVTSLRRSAPRSWWTTRWWAR